MAVRDGVSRDEFKFKFESVMMRYTDGQGLSGL